MTCTPGRTGSGDEAREWGEAVTVPAGTGPVQPFPGQARGLTYLAGDGLARAEAPCFRVASYNILADQYAATDRAKTVLFAHCPPECVGAS